jgi:hypothetical protein
MEQDVLILFGLKEGNLVDLEFSKRGAMGAKVKFIHIAQVLNGTRA